MSIALVAKIKELEERVQKLEQEIAELKERKKPGPKPKLHEVDPYLQTR